MGVDFRRCAIERLVPEADGAWRIETDAGPVPAKRVVVAMGAWSGKLLSGLGVTCALEAERGYHLVFRDPGVTLNNAIMNVDGEIRGQLDECRRALRGHRRVRGRGCAAGLPPGTGILRGSLNGCSPISTSMTRSNGWGRRPSTLDSVPFLGDIPGFENLYAAFGHGHTGLTMAPKTGEILAGLIAGETLDVDMTPYRIDRFG